MQSDDSPSHILVVIFVSSESAVCSWWLFVTRQETEIISYKSELDEMRL